MAESFPARPAPVGEPDAKGEDEPPSLSVRDVARRHASLVKPPHSSLSLEARVGSGILAQWQAGRLTHGLFSPEMARSSRGRGAAHAASCRERFL